MSDQLAHRRPRGAYHPAKVRTFLTSNRFFPSLPTSPPLALPLATAVEVGAGASAGAGASTYMSAIVINSSLKSRGGASWSWYGKKCHSELGALGHGLLVHVSNA